MRHYDRSKPRFAVHFEDGSVVDDAYFTIVLNTNPYTFLGDRRKMYGGLAGVNDPVASPGEAIAAVDAQVTKGVDFIKLWLDSELGTMPKMPPAISQAIIDAAHKRNARVLAHVFNSDNRQPFIDSLSIAGSDGTLEKRFRDSDLRGRVFAKSGYVAGVSSLSGYVKTKDDRWFAFSILMNGVSDVASAKAIQERVVIAIDRQAR